MAEPGKTEKATPKKREEARKKGQVVRSVEINTLVNVLVAMIILKLAGSHMLEYIRGISAHFWGNALVLDVTPDAMGHLIFFLITRLIIIVLPLLLAVFIAEIIINIAQLG